MARVNPPTIPPAPTPAPQRGDRATFSDRVDAFVLWLTAAVAQFQALATNVYNNALDAFGSAEAAAESAAAAATQASTATSAANAAAWVSGTSYTIGKVVYSPIDKRSYRRATNGAGTTDPSLDKANWVLLSNLPDAAFPLASIKIASPSATIDFLNVFSSAYDNYSVEILDAIPAGAGSDSFCIRLANAGVIDADANYINMSAGGNTSTSLVNKAELANTAGEASSVVGLKGVCVSIEIRNVNSARLKNVAAEMVGLSSNLDNAYQVYRAAFAYTKATSVSGFRFSWNNGANFAVGATVRVYGWSNIG